MGLPGDLTTTFNPALSFRLADYEEILSECIITLANQQGRYGERRMIALLRNES